MSGMKHRLPPAILLGGMANALSVARSLGRAGVKVYALNSPDAHVNNSRYCTPLRPPGGSDVTTWADYLLGPASDPLRGSVLLACGDTELEFVARNREQLGRKYLLDLSEPEVQLGMLDKLYTYQRAATAGVPLPRYWTPQTREQVEELRDTLEFPLLVKPLHSHVSEKRLATKLVVARTFEEALKAWGERRAAGVDVMLVEMIPGPDDRLCSYYTYLDEQGDPLFHFTKRIIRRYPLITGGGCCHITDWNHEVKDLGLQFLRAVGVRGLAMVEFKRDDRDGRLKLIECNARFSAANQLVVASGLDLGLFVYNRVTERPLPVMNTYRTGLRLWNPSRDFRAFLELRRRGQLTLRQWLASVARPRLLPCFSWRDPWPTLVHEARAVKHALARRLGRRRGGVATTPTGHRGEERERVVQELGRGAGTAG